jgi:putative DNA methylase
MQLIFLSGLANGATCLDLGNQYTGARELAKDVRYYGRWIRDEAENKIGFFYPDIDGRKVIAWLWARTVKCPNAACGCQMPLV